MKSIRLLLAALVLVGCSGGGSEEPEQTDPNAPVGDTLPGAPGPGATTTPPTEPKGPGGGATPAPTTPGPGATPSSGVFTGAPAYTATLGPSTIDTSGKGNGHLSFNAAGNPAGRACLSCHDGAGKGGAPAFLFAGTIYEDKAATKVAPKVEVRMVGADGKGLSAYTDVNGNFFFRTSAGTTTVPATAGARTATTVRSMANKLNDANCNECHAATSRITLGL